MKWTDENIDKLFQDGAEKLSFDYKPEYWEEFSASLPPSAPSPDLTDEELDNLFKESASKSSFSYKPEYWEEFSASLPIIVPTEEVNDAEVDELYRSSVRQLSFKYKHSYWEEMAAIIQRRRRPDFLWFGFSGVFATAIVFAMFNRTPEVEHSLNLVQNSSNTPKTIVSSVSGTNNSSPSNDLSGNAVNVSQNETGDRKSNAAFNNTSASNHVTNSEQIASNNATTNSGNTNNINPNTSNIVSTDNSVAEETISVKPLKALRPSLLTGITPATKYSIASKEEVEITERLRALEISTENPWNAGLMPPHVYNRSTLGIYVQGIGGVSQSSITPSEHHSYSYGIGAGVLINRDNWTFGLGSNLLLENYKDLHLTRTAKVYGFGSDLYKFDLHYQQLYVAELDLSAAYNLGRHQVRIGVRPSYTFSSRVNIAETSISSKNGETIENEEQRTSVYGFMNGVQQFGIKPMIGYGYNFRSNWSIGVNLSTELMPSIDEDFINGENNVLPFDGQLYIRKTFNLRK